MAAPTFPIYLTKEVTNVVATAGTWTLTLSDVDGIIEGMRFSVNGFTTASWNVANETVDSVNTTNKTVTYTTGSATVATQATWAQFHLRCNWIALEDLEAFLGYEFPAGTETDWAQLQVDAANDWAYRTRRSAGYEDHPNGVPGHDVGVGVTLYAAQLVRQRGAVDGYASFEAQTFGAVPGQTLGQILGLLGCKRPQVA